MDTMGNITLMLHINVSHYCCFTLLLGDVMFLDLTVVEGNPGTLVKQVDQRG